MKFLLTSIGTRGDMEPFLAIGELLNSKGHEVVCLFPEQFRDLAISSGLSFESLGPEFIEMLESVNGRIAMGGGGMNLRKMKAYRWLIKMQGSIHSAMMKKQEEIISEMSPDRVIHNGKCMYPVVWGVEHPGKNILITPVPYMHYVKDQAHIAFNRNFGAFLNKWTYQLANWGLLRTIRGSLKDLEKGHGIKSSEIRQSLFNGRAIYTISPSLFARPTYWPERLQVLGFHERDKQAAWQPDDQLIKFLNENQEVIMVTFGSMVNNAPAEKTRIVLEVLKRHRISAVINTAAGGLIKPENFESDHIFFVERIPYDWVMPRLHAVIHHGGSGTTHTGLKYGCSTLIIPHIIDQYVWNKIAHRKGVGPLGMDVSKLSERKLEKLVLDLISNERYKENARLIQEEMARENLEDLLCEELLK